MKKTCPWFLLPSRRESRIKQNRLWRSATTAALVCTSDVHTVDGAIGERANLTLGHEAVGVIYKLGSAVKGFHEGDRVGVNAITPCYQCENCLRSYTSQCQEMLGGWKFANVKDGNLAEYFHVNSAQANLAVISTGLTDEQVGYCAYKISTGFMGAEHANIPPLLAVWWRSWPRARSG